MSRFLIDTAWADPFTYPQATDQLQNLRPQADLINPDSDFQALKISSNKIGVDAVVGGWRTFDIAYTDYSAAGTTSADHTIVSLGAGAMIHYVKVVTTEGFTGGGATVATLNVGTTPSNPNEYINGDSVFVTDTTSASGTYTGPSFLTENGSTSILSNLTSDVNTDQLTAGAAKVFIYYSIANAGL